MITKVREQQNHELLQGDNQILHIKTVSLLDLDVSSEDNLIKFGETLETVAFGAAKQGVIDKLVATLTQHELEELVTRYGIYEVMIDRKFVKDVINGKVTKPEEYRFTSFYQDLARHEYNLAKLKPGSRVLHGGSGPCPGTDIWLYKQFGVSVTGVEINPNRAEEAKQVLSRLGIYGSSAVNVISSDLTRLAPEGYDLVIISAMVPTLPTRDSINNLIRLASPGGNSPVRLILREPFGAGKLFYPSITQKADFAHITEIGNSGHELSYLDRILSRLYSVQPLGRVVAGLKDPLGWHDELQAIR